MSLVEDVAFPTRADRVYLNTASINLMYSGAHQTLVSWFDDTAASGTVNFDEDAEERVFDKLRDGAARLFGAQATDIAVGSSATELFASLAWAVSPRKDQNIVGTSARKNLASPNTIG